MICLGQPRGLGWIDYYLSGEFYSALCVQPIRYWLM